MYFRFLAISFLTISISCHHISENDPAELYGRWILDSTSGIGGKIVAGGPRGHTEFTLRPDKTFIFKWSDFDVYGEYNGVYRYDKAVSTALPRLVLSVYSTKIKDSIISSDSMIILNLNNAILKTQEKESYTLFDSILVTQNRINVYRKSGNPN